MKKIAMIGSSTKILTTTEAAMRCAWDSLSSVRREACGKEKGTRKAHVSTCINVPYFDTS